MVTSAEPSTSFKRRGKPGLSLSLLAALSLRPLCRLSGRWGFPTAALAVDLEVKDKAF
jgi:hypothetical protein